MDFERAKRRRYIMLITLLLMAVAGFTGYIAGISKKR